MGIGALGSIFVQEYSNGPNVDLEDVELIALFFGSIIMFMWAYVSHLKRRIIGLEIEKKDG